MLNAEQASLQKVLANKELQDIVSALGCGIGDGLRHRRKLRYDKIFLLMDADSDGHHIATLLLTFFYRHLRPLIDDGHVYLAQPPLYRIDVGKETLLGARRGATATASSRSAAQERQARHHALQGPRRDARPTSSKTTTLDPKHAPAAARHDRRTTLETDQVINELMGKDVEARFKFIMERAAQADLDL